MKLFGKLIFGFICGIALSHLGWAAGELESKDALRSRTIEAIASRFPGAKIEILPGSQLPSCPSTCSLKNATLIQESGTGIAELRYQFSAEPTAMEFGKVQFSATVQTWIAKRRIRPGEKLSSDDFEMGNVDVSKGLAYQYRGLMLKNDTNIEGLQARLTILEGQYPLSNGVEKSPNVRKGDQVQVKLTSGDIQLLTQATAQEPGFEDQKIRVITQKNKKELTGMLREGGIVEVKL